MMNREWRYVPIASQMSEGTRYFRALLTKEEYDAQRGIPSSKKEIIQNGDLKFESKDIEYIFVKKESEIPVFIKAIRKSKNIYKNNDDLDLLISKILSIERIKNDF